MFKFLKDLYYNWKFRNSVYLSYYYRTYGKPPYKK